MLQKKFYVYTFTDPNDGKIFYIGMEDRLRRSEKFSGENHPCFGTKITEEHKKKISESRLAAIESGQIQVLVGEKHPNAKLKVEQVLEIRSLYATGEYSLTQLATRFAVSFRHISDIVNRKRWRSI